MIYWYFLSIFDHLKWLLLRPLLLTLQNSCVKNVRIPKIYISFFYARSGQIPSRRLATRTNPLYSYVFSEWFQSTFYQRPTGGAFSERTCAGGACNDVAAWQNTTSASLSIQIFHNSCSFSSSFSRISMSLFEFCALSLSLIRFLG